MTKKRSTRYRLSAADWILFAVCALGAAVSLGLYYRDINSYSLKSGERTVAIVSFKRNTVQRKFIDNDIWEKLNNQSPVYNGDKIRTASDSAVFANFENSDAKIQLNENSLIQIFDDKKEKSIEFIGGEILLTSGTEEKVAATIKTGKKKISAAPKSQVKIIISKAEPKTDLKEQAPQEAIVEVIEGEARIDDIEKPKKNSARDGEAKEEAEILKAGEQAVLDVAVPQEDAPKEIEKPQAAAPIEPEEFVADESPEEESVQEEEPAAQGIVPAVQEAPKESAIGNKAAVEEAAPIEEEQESAAAAEPSAAERGTDEPVEIQEDFVAPPQKISSVKISKNVFNQKTGEHNFMYSIPLRKLFGPNKTIPAGALIEVTISGVSDKACPILVPQFSNGTNVWKEASAYFPRTLNGGRGLRAGGHFEDTFRILLQNEIETTSRGHFAISYESKYFDEELSISDFTLEAKIFALDQDEALVDLRPGNKGSFNLDRISLPRVPWGNGSGFELFIPTQKIWGHSKSVPKGSKIKIEVKGNSSEPLEFMNLNLYNARIGTWDKIQEQRIDGGGKTEINYSGTIALERKIQNSDASIFQFTFNTTGKKVNPCQLSNISVAVEIVQ